MSDFSNPGPRLAGRIAVVTGAGSRPDDGPVIGTGAAIARLFAQAGAAVAVVDIDEGAAEHTVAKIRAAGGRAASVIADLADPHACAAAIEGAMALHGPADILVNNAALTSGVPINDLDHDAWDHIQAVNLRATAMLIRAMVAHLPAEHGGSIINVASVAALRGFHTPAYAAAKGGMLSLTTDLSVGLGPRGIRVNALLPGHVDTPMVRRMDPSADGRIRRQFASPLASQGTGWDVAWAALFLAGHESRWITGAQIPVDAGLLVSAPLAMFDAIAQVASKPA